MRATSKKDLLINMLSRQIRVRCLIEGCRYSIKGIDDILGVEQEDRDKCIWCGTPRVKQQFYGITVPDLISKEGKDEKAD